MYHTAPGIEIQDFHGIITASEEMRRLFEIIRRVARARAPVLIRGESGTGKELVARALHACSPRAAGPFRAINCATLTPELLASTLFGHVRGAFTGAIRDRVGLFAQAYGGTLFLDEIAEMPLGLQARLLRVIQEQSFVPVGGVEPIKTNIRILSATHQALRDLVAVRRFREDLMYRVRVVPLFLPPLAAREGDIAALTWRFIETFNQEGLRRVIGVDEAAMRRLLAYPWPGNVRELKNVIEHAFAIGEGEIITCDELTPELRGEAPERGVETAESQERRRLLDALEASQGRKGEAAERLNISRSTLWRKLREHGIVGTKIARAARRTQPKG
ncbi:sigma 54-interacting transcriptional regulator [Myxococcota bacterium]|nr:sigma 54-interacting transcriptional regulator [Myxococcota bacterium]